MSLRTPLQDHQQRVVDRIQDEKQPGLVVVHGLGSGKTLTSIAAADALGGKSTVVVPAALEGNYAKELTKHLDTRPRGTDIRSLEGLARHGADDIASRLLVVDEAHRLRNPGKARQALENADAEKRLLLTGSLFYNHPADMAPLINMAADKPVLPQNPTEFSRRFIRETVDEPGFLRRLLGAKTQQKVEIPAREREPLKAILRKYVDYHPGNTEGFPVSTEQVIDVPMSTEQRKIYETLLAQAPPWVAHKIRNQLPPNKTESQQLNAFLSGVRQVSNTSRPYSTADTEYAPKLDRAVQELKKALAKNPQTRAVVFSNWLDAGVKPYEERLRKEGIPYGVFTGDQSKKVRDQYVRDYNAGKIKALLLSGAGSEGLDLKGTRLMQILDPHWNEERIKQVIGRGIRFKSHDHLAPEDRNVQIQRYVSSLPKQGFLENHGLADTPLGVDNYLRMLSEAKERRNELFRQLLRESAKSEPK